MSKKIWNAESGDWQGRILDVVQHEPGAIGLLVEIYGPRSFKRCVDVGNIKVHKWNVSEAEIQFDRQGLKDEDVNRVKACIHSYILQMSGTFRDVDENGDVASFVEHVQKVYVTKTGPDFDTQFSAN